MVDSLFMRLRSRFVIQARKSVAYNMGPSLFSNKAVTVWNLLFTVELKTFAPVFA